MTLNPGQALWRLFLPGALVFSQLVLVVVAPRTDVAQAQKLPANVSFQLAQTDPGQLLGISGGSAPTGPVTVSEARFKGPVSGDIVGAMDLTVTVVMNGPYYTTGSHSAKWIITSVDGRGTLTGTASGSVQSTLTGWPPTEVRWTAPDIAAVAQSGTGIFAKTTGSGTYRDSGVYIPPPIQVPTPPAGSATPPAGTTYPTAPSGTAYPTAPSGTAYPTAPSGTAYPTAPSGTAYPTAPSGYGYSASPVSYPTTPAGIGQASGATSLLDTTGSDVGSMSLELEGWDTPLLASPATGASLAHIGTTLEWRLPLGATQLHLQVVPANNDGPAINLIRNAERTFELQPPVLGEGNYVMLPGMTYSWRVRSTANPAFAPEDDPSWGPWSDWNTFRTPAPSSAGISPVSPTDGSTLAPDPQLLQWANTATDIFYYELQVSPDRTFETDPAKATASVWSNLVHGGVADPFNSWTTPPLQPGVTYYWRVRPRIQGDGTPVGWSTTWSFRAQASSSVNSCDPAYPDVCIPSPPPDLNCADITARKFRVLPPDPHRFDTDSDGIGCEQ